MKKLILIICLAVVSTLLPGCKQDVQIEDIDKTSDYESNNKDRSSDEKLFSGNEIDIETSSQTKDNADKNPNVIQNNIRLKLNENKVTNAKTIVGHKNNDYNDCIYYNKNDFYSTMNLEVDKTYEDVSGLVCTHHLLASQLLHEGFLKIEDRDAYNKVLVIGPDHHTTDSKNIYSCSNDWETPFGILEIEDNVVESLSTYPKIVVDNKLMEREHSNAALIPFIKYYFENAKIINLAIPGTLDLGEILDFSKFLKEKIIDEKTIFITSIDFSHYLDYETANLMDEETMEEIKNKNYPNIYNFTNDNLDSPSSMIVFLDLMDKKNKELNIINNKNSFDIISVDDKNTTSYFTLIYN